MIINPIRKIILASREFAQGNFSRRINLYSSDEIGELARILNHMAEGIEEKIKQVDDENQQLRAIFNSMVEGVIVLDKAGRLISINPTVEKIFGVLKNGAEGKLFLEAIPNNDIAEIISEVLKSGEAVSKELALVWPVQKIFQVNALPLSGGREVIGCLVVIHDITQIRKLETVRRDFVANVSHELKTPLTSIKGFIETLLEGALEKKDEVSNFLKIIQEQANRLDSLINDLLELSYLESGQAKPSPEELSLRHIVDEILSGFRAQLKKRAVEAVNDIPAQLFVKADKEKIRQALVNLLSNAIKFNKDKGFIRIYAQEFGEKVTVTVEDSGIGIPAKDIPRIFERFYRVDKARSRELGGTGLGLSIVKHIVELHGGSVGVESTEGLGSRFFFTLPK